jgi:hypothetical protein
MKGFMKKFKKKEKKKKKKQRGRGRQKVLRGMPRKEAAVVVAVAAIALNFF